MAKPTLFSYLPTLSKDPLPMLAVNQHLQSLLELGIQTIRTSWSIKLRRAISTGRDTLLDQLPQNHDALASGSIVRYTDLPIIGQGWKLNTSTSSNLLSFFPELFSKCIQAVALAVFIESSSDHEVPPPRFHRL